MTVDVKVTEPPKADGLGLDPTAVVVAARPTLKVPVAELAPKLPCAAYVAFREWFPVLGFAIVKVATPLLSGCVCVMVGDVEINVTDPVGVTADELTVTVTIPSAPNATAGALIAVVVEARFTVCV